jgi:hypothetical protein
MKTPRHILVTRDGKVVRLWRLIFQSTAQTKGQPGYPERSGQLVEVLGELKPPAIDPDEVGPMYRIRFSDGVETDVFEDELEAVQAKQGA